MSKVPLSEDVRSRRQVRPPRWISDYTGYVLLQAAEVPAVSDDSARSEDGEGSAERRPSFSVNSIYGT